MGCDVAHNIMRQRGGDQVAGTLRAGQIHWVSCFILKGT